MHRRRNPETGFSCRQSINAAAELQRTADRVSKQLKMPRLTPKDWDERLWALWDDNFVLILSGSLLGGSTTDSQATLGIWAGCPET